jgi:hypothetical protein
MDLGGVRVGSDTPGAVCHPLLKGRVNLRYDLRFYLRFHLRFGACIGPPVPKQKIREMPIQAQNCRLNRSSIRRS